MKSEASRRGILWAFVLLLVVLPFGAWGQEHTVTDDADRRVELEGPAQRIVVTSPANTQLVLALGVGDRVVGVTSVTDYLGYVPEMQRIAEEKPKVGDASGLNFEQIVSLSPDLVVLDGDQQQKLSRLEELGADGEFSVYVNSPQNVEGIIENLGELGTLTGANDVAERIEDEMRSELAELEELVSGLQSRFSMTYIIYGPDPLWTAGSGTFLNRAFEGAGLTNVFDDVSGYTQVSREQVIDRDPQVVILSADVPVDMSEVPEVFGSSMNAVENDRVFRVSSELGSMLEQRQTEIVRGMLELHRLVYGESQ